jgi:hypothetical protein
MTNVGISSENTGKMLILWDLMEIFKGIPALVAFNQQQWG